MTKFIKDNLLLFSVFVTGACVLIIEVTAVRILSPYYGNTIFTVSSVISVILAALSIGYYAGGKFADRHPSLRWFFGIIMLSGVGLLMIHQLGLILLPLISLYFSLTIGPLITSLFLFFLPALLLGTLSPYAIKLQKMQKPEQGVGSVAGKIFFWSTLGSIGGSLSAGFIFIPRFGINFIIIITGILLFFLGLIPLTILGIKKKRFYQLLFMIVFLLTATILNAGRRPNNVIYSKDGIYEKITIYEGTFSNRPTRFFQQDLSLSGAMFLDSADPTDLVYDYTKYYSLYKLFNPDIKNALVIGGGAYSIPKALLAELPEAEIDVAEIEPMLFELAKQYFALSDSPRLHNYAEDGRRFLKSANKKYDLIFSDVYYSLYSMPAHFTTQEFFSTAQSKLSSNGIFVANLIGGLSRQQPSLIMSEIKTFQSVFSNSYFLAVDSPHKTGSQNIIFVGYNSSKKIDLTSVVNQNNQPKIIKSLPDRIINLERYDLSPYPILTDNFSPVEHLSAKILRTAFNKPLFDGAEMLAIINQQLSYGPRYIGAVGHDKVKKFLLSEMNELADELTVQTWDYDAQDGKNYTLTNIIARLYPEQKSRLILATHYDSKKLADRDFYHKNQPVPGANDSASGVAILVELARILKDSHVRPNIGVDIVFFDGEEGNLQLGNDYSHWQPLGSTYFAQNLDKLYGNNRPLTAMVLDMVGDKDLRIYQEGSSVKYASTQVEKFWNLAKKVDSRIFQDQVGPAIGDDHTPLNQAGVPSFLLIDFEYPYYHTTQDTLDKCSADSLAIVAQAIFEYLYSF